MMKESFEVRKEYSRFPAAPFVKIVALSKEKVRFRVGVENLALL